MKYGDCVALLFAARSADSGNLSIQDIVEAPHAGELLSK